MKPIGFIQYGNFFEYKERIKKIGKRKCFKKGTDVIPFLKGNHYAFYIDVGTLYLRLYKAEGCYMQIMSYKEGTIFPLYDLEEEFIYDSIQMLVAVLADVHGYIFPLKEYRNWRMNDIRFSRLLESQLAQTVSYLSVAQLLYRDGECITRICNLLYHSKYYKMKDPEIVQMVQEELAYTVNASKSQVKRALAQLKDEGGIEIVYGNIIIKDISIIKKYISESVRVVEEESIKYNKLN